MNEQDLTRLLDSLASRIPAGPAPVDGVLDQGERRLRRRKVLMVAGVAVTAALFVIAGFALRPDRTNGSIPVAKPSVTPTQSTRSTPVKHSAIPACRNGSIDVALGNAGSFQGDANFVDFTNVGAATCELKGRDIQLSAETSAGSQSSIQLSVTIHQGRWYLRSGQTAALLLAASGRCANTGPFVDRLDVTFDGQTSHLGGLRLPVGCGKPTTIRLYGDSTLAPTAFCRARDVKIVGARVGGGMGRTLIALNAVKTGPNSCLLRPPHRMWLNTPTGQWNITWGFAAEAFPLEHGKVPWLGIGFLQRCNGSIWGPRTHDLVLQWHGWPTRYVRTPSGYPLSGCGQPEVVIEGF